MLDIAPAHIAPLFKTTSVDRRVALRAWPLVQLSHPGVSREEWLSFAISTGRRLGKTGGAVAIEDSRGYIHAVFCWHVTRTIRYRKAMRVCDMVVGALPGQRLAETIVAAIRDLAADVGAESVLVEIGDRQLAPDSLLSDGFEHFVMHCMRIDKGPEAIT